MSIASESSVTRAQPHTPQAPRGLVGALRSLRTDFRSAPFTLSHLGMCPLALCVAQIIRERMMDRELAVDGRGKSSLHFREVKVVGAGPRSRRSDIRPPAMPRSGIRADPTVYRTGLCRAAREQRRALIVVWCGGRLARCTRACAPPSSSTHWISISPPLARARASERGAGTWRCRTPYSARDSIARVAQDIAAVFALA